jgi:uncharacterized protein (TIGR03118 family)
VNRTDIVSDLPGALRLDPTLVNAWGLAFGAGGAAWVSAAGSGISEIYGVNGQSLLPPVTIPVPEGVTGTSAPTGQVFNPNPAAFLGDRFIFATEEGAIAGWQPPFGQTAVLRIGNFVATDKPIFKGVTIASFKGAMRLFAADFHNGAVITWDETYKRVQTSGGFEDSQLPAGYAPFNVQEVEGALVVTYAKQDEAREDEVAGPGLGFVDLFDTDGNLVARLASDGALNAPWGVAVAPIDFGRLSRRLLIGNFGDGRINVYRLETTTDGVIEAQREGALGDERGAPLSIDGLWAIRFGVGAGGFDTHVLYFTAGPDDETHGVFGALSFENLIRRRP